MTRKLLLACVLVALSVTILAGSLYAYNPRVAHSKASVLQNYAITDRDKEIARNSSGDKTTTIPTSLGAFAADGGSPGYIVGRTWRDDQAHINPGNLIDWGSDGTVHFIMANQVCAGYDNPNSCARWLQYNMFNPTVSPGGVFVNGTTGIPLQPSPLAEGGHFPQMVMSESDHIIVAGEALDPNELDAWAPWTKIWWDVSPASLWGTFQSDTLPMTRQTNDTDLRYQQPRIDRQEYNGNYILHVVSLFEAGVANETRAMYYHRKEAPIAGPSGTWTSMMLSNAVWSNHYDIGTAPDGSGVVSIAWVNYYDGMVGDPPLYFITSNDAGINWSTEVDISGRDSDPDEFAPWAECNVHIDSDGYSHVVWNAGQSGTIDPQKIFHWTNRIAGPIAGGSKSLIDWSQNVLGDVDCTVSSNAGVSGKPVLSECNGRLYVLWQQFGNLDFPDDCAADSVSDGFRGGANSDLYMNVSLSLDGALWDFRRNLTNTHTPGCDGSDENPCDHDSFASPAKYGMNTAGIGTTYWSSVPEAFGVRDALDNSYPDDGYYIDVQFVNDIIADVARYMDTPHWSNNPIKWFRLPCVPPVIEPRIFLTSDEFLHPVYWVPSGQELTFDIDVDNIGNDDLSISSIAAAYVEGAGWLQVNTTSLDIPPASSDVVSVTLNPGGTINPTGFDAVAIEGYVVFTSNDPNNPVDSFLINSVIAQEVVQITYDTLHTGLGVPLVVSNNGTVGAVGEGGNLQFYEEGGINLDCDSELVYLYDASPVIMYDASNYFWSPYWDPTAVDPAVNLFPVPGGATAKTGSTGAFEQYTTGQFTTGDSAIGMIKTWVAPTDNVSYMIERWEVYSYDGAAHTGVQLGEWVDMDVPSDTGANNVGTVVEADDYLYVSGQESDGDGCVPSDGRFYATGLLGYYWMSDYNLDTTVNSTGLAGAYVTLQEDLMDGSQEFIADSVWAYLTAGNFNANNSSWDDQRSMLAFGSFDIPSADTLVIWVVHGSLIEATEPDVATMISDAKSWYLTNRSSVGSFGCCGTFTGGYPGNTDCDEDGKRNLADITKLIDHVYISKAELCCGPNGNVDGDPEDKHNLADITKLIDLVYISKSEVPPCL